MAFAPSDGVSFDVTASLAIAITDLKVVSLLRDAINSGLPKTGPLGTIPPGANPATPRPHQKFGGGATFDRTAPAGPVIRPSARFEPRAVFHPDPRIVELPSLLVEPPPLGDAPRRTCAIPPVWKTLPPVEAPGPCAAAKVFTQKVDLITIGTLLDLFI
ncbi:MAG TPA: hypothetical protein VF624_15125 [Tepidisphaeraceae bacterium]